MPNLIYIKELSRGDKSFEDKLIKIIKFEFPQEKEEYYKNLNQKNYLKTAEIVHKLKHKISIFGLYGSYETAIEYENNLRGEDVNLSDEFEIILKDITNFLNKI